MILLAPELFRAEGGIARVSRHYLQAMAEASPDAPLHVVVLNDQDISPDALHRYSAGHAQAVGANRSKWVCLRALWRATAGGDCHVVCTHVHLAPLLWIIAKVRPGLHYDVVVHGIEVWRDLPSLLRQTLAGARRIFSVSDYTRREVERRQPKVASKLVVLPNALDPGFPIAAAAHTTQPYSILTVSRLAPHDEGKGIDHLIGAMPDVVAQLPTARLRIVGEGADRPRLEALANASTARPHIQFLGYVDEASLKAELARCALFALPSRKEGFGLVYLEAMAAGKPCLAAEAGGAPEVVDATSGCLVPYGGGPPLVAALVAALTRTWSVAPILARAQAFSFASFSARWRSLNSPPHESAH